MRVHFRTLGCRLNEAETEQWVRGFQAHGYALTTQAQAADIIVLNTCAVTQAAARKSRQLLRQLRRHNPRAYLVATGCQVSLPTEQASAALPVDLIVANSDKEALVKWVLDSCGLESSTPTPVDDQASSLFERGRQRAFIKVQDGCRWRCSFCVVTLARGDERSRPIAAVIEDIQAQQASGIGEVVLTGVHVGGYGHDLGCTLRDLIEAILAQTDLPRLRLASVEPWNLPADFFQLFASPRLLPHLHLPLQSGADAVLKRMARRCLSADFADLVQRARAAVPALNITTDIIAGFPGETADDWQQTLDFVAAMGFGHVHVFPYSPRAGTKAATWPDDVPDPVKRARVNDMLALSQQLKQQAMQAQVGTVQPVLWEGIEPASARAHATVIAGYTPQYLRVRARLPAAPSSQDRPVPQPSDITPTRLLALDEAGDALHGEPLQVPKTISQRPAP